MGRYSCGVLLLTIVLSLYAASQERYESGPLKGFTIGQSSGNAIEISEPFRVCTVKGVIEAEQGNVPVAGAVFQMRDDTGAVFTATADNNGKFSITNATAATYTIMITARGFHAAIGTLVVSRKCYRHGIIRIRLHVGT